MTCDPLFLEFYGALLGDGWLSALSNEKKKLWWVGVSGHAKLDKSYLEYLAKNIKALFKKEVYFKFKKGTNGLEFILCHKALLLFLNRELGFPIGLKSDLKIADGIAADWEKLKPVIRGIFDTDGCFYLDKTPVGRPYPCLSITMKAPVLLGQIKEQLVNHGFKCCITGIKLLLKGSIQINKWMVEIGSNNPKHKKKYELWKSSCGATWIAQQHPKLKAEGSNPSRSV